MTRPRHLQLATHLALPLEAVTQTIAILAKRRAGKSYAMRRLIEQLFKAGQQIVIVDPKGDQWGVRSAADGKAPGLPIVILGGERGDAPLEAGAGEVVAKLVVEERVSVLLDLSLFRKHEVATFMTAFLEHLYRLKAREIYRTPVMLVIDEADAVAPQKPQKGEERMLGAAEDIVRRGGQRGIGCVLVTQRSAVLNKNVLTQAQVLVALRTIAPQDLAAMNAWIDVHGTEDQKRTLMESLPSLPVGDAWVWSPGWPTVDGIFKRVHILPIETFDSGKSPEPGTKPVEPKNLADVDLAGIRRQMAATIEKAKADDPKELRKQIATLTSELAGVRKSAPSGSSPSSQAAKVNTPLLTDADRALLDKVSSRLSGNAQKADEMLAAAEARAAALVQKALAEYLNSVRNVGVELAREVERVVTGAAVLKVMGKLESLPPGTNAGSQAAATRSPVTPASFGRQFERAARVEPPPPRSPDRPVVAGDPSIGKSGLRRMLIALAQRPNGLTRRQLGLRAQVSAKGGSFDTYLSKARTNAWVDTTGDRIVITDAGVAALGAYEPLPEGRELLAHYLREFGTSGAARMLSALADAYPAALSRADLSERANVSAAGGSFDTYLSKLRTLELIQPGRELRASEEFFS